MEKKIKIKLTIFLELESKDVTKEVVIEGITENEVGKKIDLEISKYVQEMEGKGETILAEDYHVDIID